MTMHDTDTSPPALQHTRLKGDGRVTITQAIKPQPQSVSANTNAAKPRGLVARMAHFFARLFTRKQKIASINITEPAAQNPDALTPADRKAASQAAQMSPPVAFIGDTASTLVTPMGAYAGKPVEQAMRKRAEQQFKNMDVTQATMN